MEVVRPRPPAPVVGRLTWAKVEGLGDVAVKLKVIVHEAEEGGYWAEVPSIPGCATQGEAFEDLLQNVYEAVEACLSAGVGEID